MRTITCKITTIAKALRANGLQKIARTLVVASHASVVMRGVVAVFAALAVEFYALAMRLLESLLPTPATAPLATPTGTATFGGSTLSCQRRSLWQADRRAAARHGSGAITRMVIGDARPVLGSVSRG